MTGLSNGVEAASVEHDYTKTSVTTATTDALSHQPTANLKNPAKASTLKLHSAMCKLAVDYMVGQGFQWIHTPRITDTTIEGDSEFFELNYFGRKSSLTQATQFHKQQLLALGLDRVFDIGPLFRAEHRLSTRHMTEFTGLEFEMAFVMSYTEAIDMAVELLLAVLTGLEREPALPVLRKILCECDAPLKLPASDKIPRISFHDAKALLRAQGDVLSVEDDQNFTHVVTPAFSSCGDGKLTAHSATEEAALGTLMRQSNHYEQTDLFVITDYPATMRGFWSVRDPTGSGNARAFDILFRGQEVVSGSQHINDAEQLREAMRRHDPPLDPTAEKWKYYVEALEDGMPPHAGCGIGMNRVLQGALGLKDVREATAFPRDAVTSAP